MVEHPRRSRRQTQLLEPLVASTLGFAEYNNVKLSSLWYMWIVQAAQLAERGYGHLLPQVPLYGTKRRIQRGTRGGQANTRMASWLQGLPEFRRCQDVINEAGSSVPACLHDAMRAYAEANGDVVAMSWPPLPVNGEGS